MNGVATYVVVGQCFLPFIVMSVMVYDGFQMPSKCPTYGGQVHDQEAPLYSKSFNLLEAASFILQHY